MDCDLTELAQNRFWKILIDRIEKHPHRNELISIHSALIVKGGSILSIGINLPSQGNGLVRSLNAHPNFSTHAEVSAVLGARKKCDLRSSKIYVARLLKKDGTLAMSKPCPRCMDILYRYGIKSCYYTIPNGFEIMRRSEIVERAA